jgi:hypothetical protein
MEPEFYYCVLNILPSVTALGRLNPVHTFHHNYFKTLLILSKYLLLGSLKSFFPSGCPTGILYGFFMYPKRVACPGCLEYYLIILTRYKYKLNRYSLHTFFQPPVTLFLIGPNIFLDTVFAEH